MPNRLQPCKFFQKLLISSTPEEIGTLIQSYEKDIIGLEGEIVYILEYADGLDWNSAWALSFQERMRLGQFIKEKLERQSGREFL